MKNMIIALLILLLSSNFVNARSHLSPQAEKIITGKVQRVTLANPEKEIRSEIILGDEKGKAYSFLIKDTTIIYNISWNASLLKEITTNNTIKVKYTTTKEGLNEANSITIIKATKKSSKADHPQKNI